MLPKNLTGLELIKKLEVYGYKVVRQKGSHIRIETWINGKHSETIPNHRPMRIGTLSKILSNIATHHGMARQELAEKLFE